MAERQLRRILEALRRWRRRPLEAPELVPVLASARLELAVAGAGLPLLQSFRRRCVLLLQIVHLGLRGERRDRRTDRLDRLIFQHGRLRLAGRVKRLTLPEDRSLGLFGRVAPPLGLSRHCLSDRCVVCRHQLK